MNEDDQTFLICPDCGQSLRPEEVLPVYNRAIGQSQPVCTRCGCVAESIEAWWEKTRYSLSEQGEAMAQEEIEVRQERPEDEGSQIDPRAEGGLFV